MPSRCPLPLPLLLLTAGGCHALGTFDPGGSDTAPSTGDRIAVTPSVLVWPDISVNDQHASVATFTIYNLGESTVTVSGQDEVMGDGVFKTDVPPLLTLEEGESRIVHVTFTPPTQGNYTADVLVQPGEESVRLTAYATSPVAEAGDVHLDAVVLGCTGTGTVGLSNTGSEPLTITSVEVSTDEYEVLDTPTEVGPGGVSAIALGFTPGGGGERGATLTITTNDPLNPVLAVPLSVLGYEGERVTESFRYAPSNPTDLLFVVEGSPDLEDAYAEATPALDSFVSTIRSTNVDYHLAAVNSADPCPATSHAFATRSDTSLQTSAILSLAFAATPGAWDDDLLDEALLSLAATDPGECLEGFRREDADLHVIVVSDGPSAGDVATQVTTLAGQVAPGAGFRLSALIPGTAECGVPMGDYEGAVRTTGGYLEDVCAADWTAALQDLATLPPGADPVSYPLAEVPVTSTIEVTVEGAPFTLWSYDRARNSVVFDGDAVPALGAEVAIEYVLEVACE